MRSIDWQGPRRHAEARRHASTTGPTYLACSCAEPAAAGVGLITNVPSSRSVERDTLADPVTSAANKSPPCNECVPESASRARTPQHASARAERRGPESRGRLGYCMAATCVRALPNTSRAVMTNGAAVPTVIGDTRAPEIVHWALQVSAGSMTNAAAFETRGEPSLPHATEHAS